MATRDPSPSKSAKRPSELDSSTVPVVKKPRRNPALSCQLCRVKKIKCDRNRPCSNCVTRKVQCVPQDGFASPPRDFQFTLAQSPGPEHRHLERHASPAHPYSYEPQVVRVSEAPMRGINILSLAASREAPLQDRETHKASGIMEEIAMGAEGYNPLTRKDNDGGYIKANGLSAIQPPPPTYPILSTLKIFPAARPLHPAALQTLDEYQSQLPPLVQARMIVANYIHLVHPLYHILHTGFIYEILDEMYSSPRKDTRKDRMAARLSLLYTVLAVGAHFWSDQDHDPVTNLSNEMLMPLSKQWRDAAIETLGLGNFLSPAKDTIEGVQAICLLQLVLHNDGESEAHRHLAGAVIRMAQTLGLHCLRSVPRPGESHIMFELKKRLWWFICSSDWLESTHGGARQGLYSINRKLVDTALPNNVDDEEVTEASCQSHSLSIPTTMSYFLVRAELSYVCLEAIEVLGMRAYSGDTELDYDKLLSIDHKYRNFVKNLPVYYRNDSRSRAETEAIIKTRPYIAWQRTMANVGINCMLIRLHRAFLIRGSQQPRYAYSRMTCLRSAHAILRLFKNALGENADFWHVMRLWVGVHHLFMACAVLAIDLCWNDDDEPHAETTRNEIMDACKILERARSQSTIAEQGINVLYAIMRKWKDSSSGDIDREQVFDLNKISHTEEPMSADSVATIRRATNPTTSGTQLLNTTTIQNPHSALTPGFEIAGGGLFSTAELTDMANFGGPEVMDWSGLLEGLDPSDATSWYPTLPVMP